MLEAAQGRATSRLAFVQSCGNHQHEAATATVLSHVVEMVSSRGGLRPAWVWLKCANIVQKVSVQACKMQQSVSRLLSNVRVFRRRRWTSLERRGWAGGDQPAPVCEASNQRLHRFQGGYTKPRVSAKATYLLGSNLEGEGRLFSCSGLARLLLAITGSLMDIVAEGRPSRDWVCVSHGAHAAGQRNEAVRNDFNMILRR